jgi:gamma-glutamylaminecyclotransferase
MKNIFICGSALRGQPDHQNLQGAKLLKETMTLPKYRLHSVRDGWHPGIYEVETGGISIKGEVYEMTEEEYEYLLANEPPNMYPAKVQLEGGEEAIAMLYPQELIEKYKWQDISQFGSWAAYKASIVKV